jgi:hypothetical protein
MRKIFYTLAAVCLAAIGKVDAQNADQLYYNQLLSNHDYQAGSFVVDTAPSYYPFKRAFLLWSKNLYRDSAFRFLSVDEFDPTGNFISQHVNTQAGVSFKQLFPKKIIRAEGGKGYYMLGYVTGSPNPINTSLVYSTPIVIKVDEKLDPVWVRRIHHSIISPNTVNALIEYNDITEAKNGEVILAGRYSPYMSGQQQRVLVTRLKGTNGNIIWSYYYFNSPICNANALSLVEAKDENIALTGYIERCTSPGYTGTRELLYMLLRPTGSPIITEKLVNGTGTSLVGDKIVLHDGDQFFISGYLDESTGTGGINRQILVVDIKESGATISAHTIGEAGTEVANDLIYKNFGGGDFYLYLTGYTTSYTQVSEAYYLQLKYNSSSGAMFLAEFNWFPRPTGNYNSRTGVEIKKAGKDRFAILSNASYRVGTQSRAFTNVLVRDLNDPSGNCIKRDDPPIKPVELRIIQLSSDNINSNFAVYRENYDRFDKVTPQLECGTFKIDAPDAGTVPGNPDEITRSVNTQLVKVTFDKEASPMARAWPNPVRDQLFIEYAKGATEHVTVKIYSGSMQFVKEYRMAGKSRISIPVQGLASGFYFVQVQGKSGTQSFKVRKE